MSTAVSVPSTATALRVVSLAGHTPLSPCLSHAQSLLGTGFGKCGHLLDLSQRPSKGSLGLWLSSLGNCLTPFAHQAAKIYASSRSPPHHPCKPLPSSYAFIISLSWFLVREARISMMTPSLVPKPWGRNLYVLECSAPVSCSACTAFSEALVMASSALFC